MNHRALVGLLAVLAAMCTPPAATLPPPAPLPPDPVVEYPPDEAGSACQSVWDAMTAAECPPADDYNVWFARCENLPRTATDAAMSADSCATMTQALETP